MNDDREGKVRERAHAIWQREGEPHGRHAEHWQQASLELDAEDAPVEARPRKRAAAKPADAVKPAKRTRAAKPKTAG